MHNFDECEEELLIQAYTKYANNYNWLFVSDIVNYGEKLHRGPNLKNSIKSLAFF